LNEGSDISGYAASGAMHAALLALIVFGFSAAPSFDDATESIPVETITPSELNEIMKGERDAKPAKAPSEPAKPAAVAEPPIPTPPEPPPDMSQAEAAPPPPPPPKPAPPPPNPPPPRPVTDEAPEPPIKSRSVVIPPDRPRDPPPEPPRPEKREDLAKLLAKERAEDAAKSAAKEARKPPPKIYDPNAIAKMLGQTKTADASSTAAPAQGLPTQHAARMSPSLAAALDAWFTDAYLSCWSPPPTTPEGERYIADVHVVFNPDGSLSGRPVLSNPPRDPAWRAHADSAVRAVLKCNPLRVPPQYAPFFEQWKTKTIHFDPQSALG
jgi:hypothetical protein